MKRLKPQSLVMFLMLLLSSITFSQETESFTDPRDGKVYKYVQIGSQVWMAENLTYKMDYCCSAYCDTQINTATYGYLYTWGAATGVCPTGWHLPNDKEWVTLINYLGGSNLAGGKLKETDTIHWKSPNHGATNAFGFTALPGGMFKPHNRPNKVVWEGVYYDSYFTGIGYEGHWWSATEAFPTSYYYTPSYRRPLQQKLYDASSWYICFDSDNIFSDSHLAKEGKCSVRCLKGEQQRTPSNSINIFNKYPKRTQ